MKIRWLFFLLTLLLPTTALASGVFSVEPTDKSMQYLATIFGTIPALPIESQSISGDAAVAMGGIFQPLVHRFNIVVFTLGIIIIIYTTLVGTISTAQEGEVLGKKWSSIWMPARIGLGMYLLLPAAGSGGYSYVQIAVLWMIVQGVGAANAIWKEIILDPNSIHEDTRKARLENSESVINALLQSAICMERINHNDPPGISSAAGDIVTTYISDDGNAVEVGRPSMSGIEEPLCGKFYRDSYAGIGDDESSSRQIVLEAIQSAFYTLEPAAIEIVRYPNNPDMWLDYGALPLAASTLERTIGSLEQNIDTSGQQEEAIKNGWIHAGSYYTTLSKREKDAERESSVTISSVSPSTAELAKLLVDSSTTAESWLGRGDSLARNYIDHAYNALDPVNVGDMEQGDLGLPTEPTGLPSDTIAAFDAIFGNFFKEAAVAITEHMHHGKDRDPIISIAKFGTDLILITETVFFGSLTLAFIAWLASGVGCGIIPFCQTMNYILLAMLPVSTILLAIVWVEGIVMALYIPMIPYLVFTFASITWIILVIEALLAAPLVGLSLVVPSEDEMGKATTGIVILFALFMRPPLMIMGFLFSMKLIIVAFTMITFGFLATLQFSVQLGIGLFGFIAVIFLYMGVVTAVIHECFSLIYKIPDQAMRWIGAQGSGADEMSKVKGLKGSVEHGAGIGKSVMSSGISIAKKAKTSGGGGGGSPVGL